MEGLSLLVLALLCAGSMAQAPTTVTLTTTTPAVTEGTATAMNFVCTLNNPAIIELSFTLMYVTTSTSEDGFDHGTVGDYCCTVAVGATAGSVSIPLIDDVVLDVPTTGEALIVQLVAAELTRLSLTDMTVAGMITVTISDNGVMTPLIATPRTSTIKVVEAAIAMITIDFLDANRNRAPAEESITFSVSHANAALDTVSATDYTDVTMHAFTHTPGTAITSTVIPVTTLTDTVIENIETINFILGDMTAATANSITGVGSPGFQVQIRDDDRTELISVQDMTPLKRRSSKKDSTIFVVTNEAPGAAWDVTDTTLGHNLRDCKRKIRTINTFAALQLTIPRPERNSKARFNEFTFTRTQTFATAMYPRTVRSFVTPTSPEEPIETDVGPVLVVYPNDQPCTALAQTYCINVKCTPLNRRQLRWSHIPDGGTDSDESFLKKYDGNPRLQLKECNKGGLYIVGRRGRRKKGWISYVRVIQAACPITEFDMAGTCAGPVMITCLNQGVLDQQLNLCTCRPGFAGATCELVSDRGVFGSNCQFKIADYFKDKENKNGKCIKYGFPDALGWTCAAGWGGPDCCDQCKRGWKFGANCGQTCHCIDDICDPVSGHCTNGCAPGFKGANCQ